MSENENPVVPESFWAVPEAFIEDATLRFLHADVCATLRQENPDADVLELMAIERVASLYIWMRAKEVDGGFKSEASYKDMIKLWITMAADLRKTRVASLEDSDAQAQIMGTLLEAINSALQGVEPEVANTVKRRIMTNLADVS